MPQGARRSWLRDQFVALRTVGVPVMLIYYIGAIKA